jgi:Response regulator of the LytR/AlgR family
MRYAIIEDEQFSRQRLQLTIERLHPDYVLDFAGSAIAEAVSYFQGKPDVDLVFLDVELADGNCFDIFDEVNVNAPVIFTTAYDEYALKAFKVHSIDYLLKPIADSDLSLAITKFERLRRQGITVPDYKHINQLIDGKDHSQRILTISGDNFIHINISDIAFFMSEDNYVYAYLTSGKRKITNFNNLAELEAILSNNDFFQLSRNITASISSIKSVSKYFRGRLLVRLAIGHDTMEVTVSANRRDAFLDWLGK